MRSTWGRATVLALSGLLGLAGVLAVWTVVSAHHRATNPNADGNPVTASVPGDASLKAATPLGLFCRRWLPEQTLLLVDLRLSRLANSPDMDTLELLGPWWQPSSQARLAELNLGPDQVRHLTWAVTDLAAAASSAAANDLTRCQAGSVVVLELEKDLDARVLLPKGENIDLGSNLTARRPLSGQWLFPILAVNAQTIVTGNEEALRQLVARNHDVELASRPLERLLRKLSAEGDATVAVDLVALRSAVPKLPTNVVDVWPAGQSNCHLLYESPLALGLSLPAGNAGRCEAGLVCGDEKATQQIRMEIEKLVPDAIAALPLHVAALKDILPPRKISAEAADHYRRLLDDLLKAMRAARCDTADGIVWLRLAWEGKGSMVWAADALESSSAIAIDWMAAARAVDETRHRGLLGGLLSYMHAQTPQRFPAAVAGGAMMLRPETRVSWIASLLPYLGHPDWGVDTSADWNGIHNRPIAQRPLPEVVNPVFGPSTTMSGYPVTRYVGVAGVGDDAATLPADDRRAGMFGYGRQTRPEDLHRGASQTIAVMGVQEQCGPWAQGGRDNRPAFDPAALHQRAGRVRQRPARRNGCRYGRWFGAVHLEGRRSPRYGGSGGDQRREARRPGLAGSEQTGRCDLAGDCWSPAAGRSQAGGAAGQASPTRETSRDD